MNRKAERWLADQEIALLEAIYELPPPTAEEALRQLTLNEWLKVRATMSTNRRSG
jgi:hypothetical protein